MTFSFIVPVHNTEKYLAKCLDSLLAQTYPNYEIIVVNDGSPDNSQAVIDRYTAQYPDKIKSFVKENGGLSDARNFGIQRAAGEYMLFIDSDDYISAELLSQLHTSLQQCAADVIRFSAQSVSMDGIGGEVLHAPVMNNISGQEALNHLIDHKQYFEPACFYAYRRAYWLENAFCYAVGMYHEDFGLTPEIIMKAASFTAIDHIGYFYVQAPNSITRNNSYDKTCKKVADTFSHVIRLRNTASALKLPAPVFQKFSSYLANAAIGNISALKNTDKICYLKQLRKEKVFDLLLADSPKRIVKKVYLKIKYGAF